MTSQGVKQVEVHMYVVVNGSNIYVPITYNKYILLLIRILWNKQYIASDI